MQVDLAQAQESYVSVKYYFVEKKPKSGESLTFESLTPPPHKLLFCSTASEVAENSFSTARGRYVAESNAPLNLIDIFEHYDALAAIEPKLKQLVWKEGSSWRRSSVTESDYKIFGELVTNMSTHPDFLSSDGLKLSKLKAFHGECIIFSRAAGRLQFFECKLMNGVAWVKR